MELEFREVRSMGVRSPTDKDSLSPADMAAMGITFPIGAADLLSGRIRVWLCLESSRIVGHCVGDSEMGEVVGISVLPTHERRGIGRRLLSLVVSCLRATGASRIWLDAPANPALRAYGFYRALGWRPTGEKTANGYEILELRP